MTKLDPRFKRIGRKATKVTVDKRFESMFEEEQFVKPVSVDKYGRSLEKDREREELKRFYRLEDEETIKVEKQVTSSDEELHQQPSSEVNTESSSSLETNSDSDSDSASEDEPHVMDEVLSMTLWWLETFAWPMPLGDWH